MGAGQSAARAEPGGRPPEAHGLADLRSDEAVYRRAMAYAGYAVRGHDRSDEHCVRRPADIGEVVVVGTFVSDSGCELVAIYVGDRIYADPLQASRAALAKLSFREADDDSKRRIAQGIVYQVLHGMENASLGDVVVNENGSVQVLVDVEGSTRSRSPEPEAERFRHRISADGELDPE